MTYWLEQICCTEGPRLGRSLLPGFWIVSRFVYLLAKINTRNSIISKLLNSRWGANPSTVRTSGLAVCFSVAESACPVWQHSIHANKLHPALNQTCSIIAGCMRPTNVDSLHILAGITPLKIRRLVDAQKERLQQIQDSRHMLHDLIQQQKGLERKNFCDIQPLRTSPRSARITAWTDYKLTT